MRGLWTAFVLFVCLELVDQHLEQWQHFDESLSRRMRFDYELLFCARLAALEANMEAAARYVAQEHGGVYETLVDSLYEQELRRWRGAVAAAEVDCSLLSGHFRIYRQHHAELSESYPNMRFQFVSP